MQFLKLTTKAVQPVRLLLISANLFCGTPNELRPTLLIQATSIHFNISMLCWIITPTRHTWLPVSPLTLPRTSIDSPWAWASPRPMASGCFAFDYGTRSCFMHVMGNKSYHWWEKDDRSESDIETLYTLGIEQPSLSLRKLPSIFAIIDSVLLLFLPC